MKKIKNNELIEHYLTLKDQVEALNKEIEDYKSEIIRRDLHGFANDRGMIKISTRRILDTKEATNRYPASEFPHFYKQAIDSTKLKQLLSAADLSNLYKETAPVVTFSEVKL